MINSNGLLLKSTNASVKNHRGEQLGEVARVTFDEDGETLRYLILKTNKLYGYEDRYFAVPICLQFVTIANDGTIIIKADIEDLELAETVAADMYRRPNLKFGRSIYELYNYRVSQSGNISRDKN